MEACSAFEQTVYYKRFERGEWTIPAGRASRAAWEFVESSSGLAGWVRT